jgi:hypothetical protein
MLALIYLAIVIWVGDRLTRSVYRFLSIPHRFSSAFLVGLITSTWITYLGSALFGSATKPLIYGNLLYLAVAGAILTLYGKHPSGYPATLRERPEGSAKWDWAFMLFFFLAVSWLMFGTLSSHNGMLRIADKPYSDFGPNIAIVQNFAWGHNFPTEYPHYAGDPIHYHFLFYFMAGNLEFLGLNVAWSINLLSILSLVAMLTLVTVLGEILFHSRTVGRIAASLFFFNTSLAYIPFLRSQKSFVEAIQSVVQLRNYLPSGYPFRGEDWGPWTLNIFTNQRHISAGSISRKISILACGS